MSVGRGDAVNSRRLLLIDTATDQSFPLIDITNRRHATFIAVATTVSATPQLGSMVRILRLPTDLLHCAG